MTAHTRHRIVAIDAVRGAALAGMIVYHIAWDAHDFGWSPVDPSRSSGWILFGHTVASTFLFLSGLGLVLARQGDAGITHALRRVGVIAAAALCVTLVTAVATPGETVRFGILHCIAASNLLALAVLGARALVVLAVAAVALGLPFAAAGRAPDWTWWLGLSDHIPPTVDVRPLLPWFGVVLLGVLFGRLADGGRLRAPVEHRRPLRALATAGRHSLLVYLVHQPLMFGLFWLLMFSKLAPSSPLVADGAFRAECQAACVKSTPADECDLFCACAEWRLTKVAPGASPSPDTIAQTVDACRVQTGKPLDLHK